LGKIKDERAVELLINAFSVECPYVQWIIIKALSKMNYEKKIELLIKALDNKDPETRSGIVYVLGESQSEKAEKLLIKMLDDDDYEVRKEAAKALRKVKPEMIDDRLATYLEEQNPIVKKKAVNTMGKPDSQKEIESIIESLNDENVRLTWGNVIKLEQTKSEKALEPSIKVLRNKKSKNRWIAIRLLGNIKSSKAVGPLIEALNDENYVMRLTVAGALRDCCSSQNKKQLEELLKSKHKFSANTAFEILYEIEKEEKSKLILFEDVKNRNPIDPKYDIFVSSVQKELENERVTIQDLVESDPFLSAHYTSLLYEYEPASPEKTLEGCLSALNNCQVYLLIVGVKCGTLLGEISITHTEYRYAKEKGFPILVFIKGERNIEREQGTKSLLKELEADDFKYKRFRNVIELRNEVKASLEKFLRDKNKFLKL
jgi:HEAT repeat protein